MLLVVVTFVGAFLLGRSSSSSQSTLEGLVQFISGNSPEDAIEKNIKLFLKGAKSCQNSLANLNPTGEGEEFNMIRDDAQNVIYQKGSLYNEVKIYSMKLYGFKSNVSETVGTATVTLILEKTNNLSERTFHLGNVELEAAHGRLVSCSSSK